MPTHFARFRYLNGGGRIRNESDKVIQVRPEPFNPPIDILPGEEKDVPMTPEGEAILEVIFEDS